MKTTVCPSCSYRFKFNEKNEIAWCPICGETQYTKNIVPTDQ